jgi:cell division transport system permease protein
MKILGQIFLNIRRYSSVSFDMISLITLFLFILGCIFLIKFNFDLFSNNVKNKLEIAIFLKNNVKINEDNKNVYEEKIVGDKTIKVSSLQFIEKEEALDKFISENPALKDQIKIIEENPIKNYFILKLENNDYRNIKKFVDSIKDLDFIDDIVYSEDLIKNVDIFLDYVTKIIFVISIFFIVILFFLFIYNIKVNLNYRKTEFILWHYLGTNSFVEKSIILGEGFVLGLISGILANFILYILHFVLAKILFNFEFFSNFYIVLIFSIGILLSMLANIIILIKSKNEKIQF